MHVLLVEPPPITPMGNLRVLGSTGTLKTDMCWPPLDLMVLAGMLEKNGISCGIVDGNAMQPSFEALKNIIAVKSPRIVIFSTSTSTILNDLKVAKAAKQVSEDIVTAAFGIHIAVLPEETLEASSHLDVAIHNNEPEPSVLALAKADGNPDDVPGICYRRNGEIGRTSPMPGFANRDDLGFPAHDKVPLHFYRDPNTKRQPLSMTLAQQGCVNTCMYCVCPQFYGNLNKRSVEHVIQEFQWVSELGVKEMRFFDSGLTHDKRWSNKLFDRMIEEKFDITWVCNARADRLNYDIAKKMKAAGCQTVCIGCESGDPQILKNVSKNETPERIAEAVSEVKRAGLDVLVYFIMGLPGETQETMKKTIAFAKKIDPKIITLNVANPQPGTLFYKYLEENDYLLTKDWTKYDPMGLPVFNYPELSGKEIHEMVQKGYRSFYLRPTYIAKRVMDIRSVYDLRNYFTNFVGFVKRYGVN